MSKRICTSRDNTLRCGNNNLERVDSVVPPQSADSACHVRPSALQGAPLFMQHMGVESYQIPRGYGRFLSCLDSPLFCTTTKGVGEFRPCLKSLTAQFHDACFDSLDYLDILVNLNAHRHHGGCKCSCQSPVQVPHVAHARHDINKRYIFQFYQEATVGV